MTLIVCVFVCVHVCVCVIAQLFPSWEPEPCPALACVPRPSTACTWDRKRYKRDIGLEGKRSFHLCGETKEGRRVIGDAGEFGSRGKGTCVH